MKTNHEEIQWMKELKSSMTEQDVKLMEHTQARMNEIVSDLNEVAELQWANHKIASVTVYSCSYIDNMYYLKITMGKIEADFFTVKVNGDEYEFIEGTSDYTDLVDNLIGYFYKYGAL